MLLDLTYNNMHFFWGFILIIGLIFSGVVGVAVGFLRYSLYYLYIIIRS
jgi:hypothetical protein